MTNFKAVLVCVVLCVSKTSVAGGQVLGTFAPTGGMGYSRNSHTETLLPDGTVLITGGCGSLAGNPGCLPLQSAELYDPATGTFSPTGDMTNPRYAHTATLLENGTVLIAGGFGTDMASAEIYDPATGVFTSTGSMVVSRLSGQPPLQSTVVGRYNHTATRLADGRVLLAGGLPGPALDAEIYDPSAGTFAAVGGNCVQMPDSSFECGMTTRRAFHTATLLDDHTVLMLGGQTGPTLVEVFDPSSGEFRATGFFPIALTGHTATRLQDGNVLIAGGQIHDDLGNTGVLAAAGIYDVATGAFSFSAAMTAPRFLHSATRLASGHVLLIGGFDGVAPRPDADEFDPVAGTIAPTYAGMELPRYAHTATLLDSGRVRDWRIEHQYSFWMDRGVVRTAPACERRDLVSDRRHGRVRDADRHGASRHAADLQHRIGPSRHGNGHRPFLGRVYVHTVPEFLYGPTFLTFKVSNGSIASNIGTISIDIAPVNDAPIAFGSAFTTPADTAATSQLSAADVDGPALTFSIVTNGTKGTATITNPATGAFTYVPTGNAAGDDSFTFKASDGTLESNVATVAVTITPVAASVGITANGSGGPVVLPHNSPLQIAVAAHTATGATTINPADMYIGLQTPSGLYWLNSSFSFVAAPSRLLSAPLPAFGPVTLFNFPNASVLPAGTYTWFIAVVNGGSLLVDFVQTTVQ